MAAGMIPVRMWSDPNGSIAMADKYLEYAFDPMMREKFSQIVDGRAAAWMDGLAISNSTDVIIRMYLYLRELKRTEPELPIPKLSFIDWLFTRNRMYQERDEMLMSRFIEEMEGWCGHAITDEMIREAGRICNENKEVLRSVKELRQSGCPRITGCEALVITGSAFFMDRQEHTPSWYARWLKWRKAGLWQREQRYFIQEVSRNFCLYMILLKMMGWSLWMRTMTGEAVFLTGIIICPCRRCGHLRMSICFGHFPAKRHLSAREFRLFMIVLRKAGQKVLFFIIIFMRRPPAGIIRSKKNVWKGQESLLPIFVRCPGR